MSNIEFLEAQMAGCEEEISELAEEFKNAPPGINPSPKCSNARRSP